MLLSAYELAAFFDIEGVTQTHLAIDKHFREYIKGHLVGIYVTALLDTELVIGNYLGTDTHFRDSERGTRHAIP